MHVPEAYLKHAISEAVRVSKKHTLFCEEYKPLPNAIATISSGYSPTSKFTFIHNYPRYLNGLNLNIKDFEVVDGCCIFRVEKELFFDRN
jgi:hypothetical protein